MQLTLLMTAMSQENKALNCMTVSNVPKFAVREHTATIGYRLGRPDLPDGFLLAGLRAFSTIAFFRRIDLPLSAKDLSPGKPMDWSMKFWTSINA